MTTEKINPKIKENLFSSNSGTVIAAINKIKEKGNKLYIPLLFDMLSSQPKKEIEDEILKLLATVRDKETTESFIAAIKNEKYKPIWKSILTTCWQNGLDFSNYLPIFVDKIIYEDWEISFEAFTIIDNLDSLPEQKTVNKTKEKISAAMETATEQKTYFLQEVLSKIS